MGERNFLRVQLTMASELSSLRRSVGGFLRYIAYRDIHVPRDPDDPFGKDLNARSFEPASPEGPKTVDGFLRYMAYRDQSQEPRRARTFGHQGVVGDAERRELVEHVMRSVACTQPRMYRNPKTGVWVDGRKALYRILISPEFGEGIDLERMTRAALDNLQRQAGAGDLRWFAAEHHNTGHPHVHLVIAGYREVSPGRFKQFELTKERLAALKATVVDNLELQRPRELDRGAASAVSETSPAQVTVVLAREPLFFGPSSPRPAPMSWIAHSRRFAHSAHRRRNRSISIAILRLRSVARRYRHHLREQTERELEERRLRPGRGYRR